MTREACHFHLISAKELKLWWLTVTWSFVESDLTDRFIFVAHFALQSQLHLKSSHVMLDQSNWSHAPPYAVFLPKEWSSDTRADAQPYSALCLGVGRQCRFDCLWVHSPVHPTCMLLITKPGLAGTSLSAYDKMPRCSSWPHLDQGDQHLEDCCPILWVFLLPKTPLYPTAIHLDAPLAVDDQPTVNIKIHDVE